MGSVREVPLPVVHPVVDEPGPVQRLRRDEPPQYPGHAGAVVLEPREHRNPVVDVLMLPLVPIGLDQPEPTVPQVQLLGVLREENHPRFTMASRLNSRLLFGPSSKSQITRIC